MAVHPLPVATGQHRNFEAEFPDAAAHAIHGGVILAGVAGVEDQPVDGPILDAFGDRRHEHTSPQIEIEGSPASCTCGAGLTNRTSRNILCLIDCHVYSG